MADVLDAIYQTFHLNSQLNNADEQLQELAESSFNALQSIQSFQNMLGITSAGQQGIDELRQYLQAQLDQQSSGLFIKYEDYDEYQRLKEAAQAGSAQMTFEEIGSAVQQIGELAGCEGDDLRGSLDAIRRVVEEHRRQREQGQFVTFAEYDQFLLLQRDQGAVSELQAEKLQCQQESGRMRDELEKLKAGVGALLQETQQQSLAAVSQRLVLLQSEQGRQSQQILELLQKQASASLLSKKSSVQNAKLMAILQVQRSCDIVAAVRDVTFSNARSTKQLAELRQKQQQFDSTMRNLLLLGEDDDLEVQIAARLKFYAQQVQQQQAQIGALTRRLSEQAAEKDQLQLRSSTAQSQIAELRQSSASALQSSQLQATARQQRADQLEHRLKIEQLCFQQSVTGLKGLKSDLRTLKKDLTKVAKSALAQLKAISLEHEQQLLNGIVCDFHAKVLKMREQLQQNEVYENTITEKQYKIDELEQLLADFRLKYGDMDGKFERLEADFAAAESDLAAKTGESKAYLERLEKLQMQYDLQSKNINEMSQKVIAQESRIQEENDQISSLQQKQIQTDELVQMNKELKDERTDMQRQLEQSQSSLIDVEQLYEQQLNEFSLNQSIIDTVQKANDKMLVELHTASSVHETAPEERDSLKELCEYFGVREEEIYEYINELRLNKQRLEDEIREIQMQNLRLKQENNFIEDDLIMSENKYKKLLSKQSLQQPTNEQKQDEYTNQEKISAQELTLMKNELLSLKQSEQEKIEDEQTIIQKLQKKILLSGRSKYLPSQEKVAVGTQTAPRMDNQNLLEIFTKSEKPFEKNISLCREKLAQGMDMNNSSKVRLQNLTELIYQIKQKLIDDDFYLSSVNE